MPTCFILLYLTHICIFQHWRNNVRDIFLSLSSTNSLRPVDAYMCQESNLAFVMMMACRLIGVEPFFNKCQFMIWHILISESLSVCGRYAVCLLSVWVRDCRSAVVYDSSIVLMVIFHSVSCRLSIGLKSGDSIPNLTRSDPDMNPTGFTVSSATLSVADSWPIHWKFCVFCRFRVGLAGVTGVWRLIWGWQVPEKHHADPMKFCIRWSFLTRASTLMWHPIFEYASDQVKCCVNYCLNTHMCYE